MARFFVVLRRPRDFPPPAPDSQRAVASSVRQRQAGQVVDFQPHTQRPPGVTGVVAGVEVAVAAGGMDAAGGYGVGNDRFRKLSAVDTRADPFPVFPPLRERTTMASAPLSRLCQRPAVPLASAE